MTRALWAIFWGLIAIAVMQFVQWRMEYDYLYEDIPVCETTKEMAV